MAGHSSFTAFSMWRRTKARMRVRFTDHRGIGPLAVGPDLSREKCDDQAKDDSQGRQHYGRHGLERPRSLARCERQHGNVDHPADQKGRSEHNNGHPHYREVI
jgi:hypothetical protein